MIERQWAALWKAAAKRERKRRKEAETWARMLAWSILEQDKRLLRMKARLGEILGLEDEVRDCLEFTNEGKKEKAG